MPPQAQSIKTKVDKLPANAKLALLLFFLAGDGVVFGLPHLTQSSEQPSFWMFLSVGLAIILLLALLFIYLSRLNLSFGRSALIITAGYSGTIGIIKFVLAPYALYRASNSGGLDFLSSDPNSPAYVIITALVIMALYIAAFSLIYNHFERRLMSVKRKTSNKKRLVSLILGIAVIFFGGGIVLIVPALFYSDQLGYLLYIFGTLGFPILLSIIMAVYLVYRGFSAVETSTGPTGNAAVLASFYWLGLSLIVLFHVMWIFFMLTLVSIWPFKTAYSK